MIRRNYFDHTTPSGTDFATRILRDGYVQRNAGWSLGENIAYGTGSFATPRNIMVAWMQSPGHRANILRRSFKEIGVGIAVGVPGGLHAGEQAGATYTTDFGAKS